MHTHSFTCVHTNRYIYTDILTYAFPYMCAYTYTYRHTHICPYMHAYTRTPIHSLQHCWWASKLLQSLQKSLRRFFKKLELPYDPAILLLGMDSEKIII